MGSKGRGSWPWRRREGWIQTGRRRHRAVHRRHPRRRQYPRRADWRPAAKATAIYLVDKPGSAQSVIRLGRIGAAEDIDLPKTIMDVQMRQMGYEAALAATAKAISPTLMDYLR